jgi:Icc-related predicted phosphoesterase
LLCLLSIAGATFAVTYFGGQTFHWLAFDIDLRVHPAWRGETRLVFTPIGEVRAQTHAAPLVLEATLRSVSFDRLQHLFLRMPSRSWLALNLSSAARADVHSFVLHLILVGAIGALIAPLLLRIRHPAGWIAAPVIGALAVTSTLYGTFRTYNTAAFRDATYVGSLREAGPILALARNAFYNANALSARLKMAAANLDVLYDRISSAPGIIEDDHTVRVLHISDIHNDAAAFNYVRELADRFHVNFIVDTGDLTDFGSAVESHLSTGIGKLGVPYLFVAGNHDSQVTVASVRKNKNAIILDGKPVIIDGLTVLGLPDPSSARAGVGSVDTSEADLDQAATRLAVDYGRSKTPPDIVCVHNPREDVGVLGHAPVILCGHVHRAYIETNGDSVVCNAGTTGGAGVRYLDKQDGVPLSAAILTFSMPPHPHLVAIDQVSLDGGLDQYSITRRTFNRPATDGTAVASRRKSNPVKPAAPERLAEVDSSRAFAPSQRIDNDRQPTP